MDWFSSRQQLLRELDAVRGDLARYERLRAMLRGSQRSDSQVEGPFRALVENASDFIAVINRDGTIRYKSPSVTRILGYAGDEILGRQVVEFIHPEDAPAILDSFRTALERPGLGPTVECRVRHKSGAWRRLEATITNLMDNPEASGLVINARDVSERAALEAQLRQSQKLEAVGQLTSGLAHDFNNILSIVLANASLVESALAPDSTEARAELADLREAGKAGADMIRKLLGFSRQSDLAMVPVDLAALVEQSTRLMRRLLPASIDVTATREDGAALVKADATAVEQILFNLATNARDAMPQGGSLRIDVAPADLDDAYAAGHPGVAAGSYVRVSVADTGHGMDEATVARVFEPFFTTKPAGHGTGLGMAMIYGLVKQHGGHVHVYSEPGHGTRVSVYFPAAAEEPRQEPRRTAEHVRHAGSETILLVEDNESLRRTGRRALERFGYTVVTAGDGREALERCDAPGQRVDLVISDVVMPRLGGRELYEELRRRRPEIRFVFASGYGARQILSDAEVAGGVAFLSKPWTLDDLSRAVRQALDAP